VSRGDDLSSVVVPLAAPALDARVLEFRRALQKRTRRDYLRHAADLYDLLIRPLQPELRRGPVDALVFVPGGSLRTIPMAALYDRESKQFLIEQVPLAIIPALTLTDPRAIERRNVRSLMGGLTLSVRGYPALENVGTEMAAVSEILGGTSLVDQSFVTAAVEEALADESYNVVHIASHGEFRANASESFLVTYDGEIGMDRLAVLVERRRFGDQPIELLTLSACETAAGDQRAALGLAGVAVRAGARSAIASLWSVNDQATSELIAEFYRQLAVEGSTRAEALRRAQISLLRSRPYRHPGYWAPFVLISNWL
jgi:CHAT domain-containing protein